MHKSMKFAASSLVALSLVTAACAKDDNDTQPAATTTTEAAASDTEAGVAEIEISDAWCRTSAAMADAGGCYMIITNAGSGDDALVGVSVDEAVAAKSEIHETVSDDGSGHGSEMSSDSTMAGEQDAADDHSGMDNADEHDTGTTMAGSGMMMMQAVDKIEIPGGETVKLEPGGYHVMLMGLADALTEGETITLTLKFANSGEITTDAEVRSS